MSHKSPITQTGIDPPHTLGVDHWDQYWITWFKRLADVFPRVRTYDTALTPAEVAANTTEEQTFTVAGLRAEDVVTVNKPSLDAGLGIVGYRVSADNTLAISFINATGGALTPTAAETYNIVAIRL